MATPILATKLYRPPARAKLVLRPRLLEQLNYGLHRRLTLISAPAGFGKTTLVSEWLASNERPAAWLSLDESDGNSTRFMTYLVAALQTISPTIGEEVLTTLQSPQPPPSEAMLTALLNDISTMSKNFIFVLDDYHLIDSKGIDDMLSFLLEHLPPQIHLVITTREDPQLPLPRLRARDQLTELRANDLRFTPEEASEFFNQVMGLHLSADDITQLEGRTEGWIAGLQMTALSMQGRTDTSSFIKAFTGSHHFILDYLAEEVLQRQPDSVQTFLLQTSILERLSGSLCNAVTEREVGKDMLETLERANLFVIPLDDKREWYRYHHLFADVLKARLLKEHPKQISDLHLRASMWFEQNGLPSDAIRHAFVAEDFERAAGLVELAFPVMDSTFQSATWFGWVEALPDALVRARPVLSVQYAWTLLYRGELEASETRLRDAERWLEAADGTNETSEIPLITMVVADEEQFRSLPATIANARAFHAQSLGDLPGTVTYIQQALDLLPEEDHLGRGTAAAILGLAQWANGDLEAAYPSVANAMASFQMAGNIMVAISGTCSMADIKVAQGRLREAIRTYERALQLASEQGEPVLKGTADLYLGLSELHHEQGNLEAARKYLLKSEALGEQAALQDWPYRLCLAQARMKQISGDLDGALDLLDEVANLYIRTPTPRPNVHPVAALKTQVWVTQGRLVEALGWIRDRDLSADDELSYLHEFEHITLARLLIAHYKNDQIESTLLEAKGLLTRLLSAAEEGKRTGSVINILLLQALAYHAQNDSAAALEPLQQALKLAEPEGYVRTFIDEGLPMVQLLSEAARQGLKSEYVAKLLLAFDSEQDKREDKSSLPAILSSQPINEALVEPLTKRELEVLQLLAEDLSNRDISKRLFRALDTVKGYNRNIFGKLQVQDRNEAVAKARELGLLYLSG